MICDADGNELAAGEKGEGLAAFPSGRADVPVHRRHCPYPRRRLWESLGDMGWLDEDGYLYLGDRLQA